MRMKEMLGGVGLWMVVACGCGVVTVQVAAQVTKEKAASNHEPSIVLGVLEDVPTPTTTDDKHTERAVRAVFAWDGERWKPFPTDTQSYRDLETLPALYPERLDWTIAFDGKNLGNVRSARPLRFNFYKNIGLQGIVSKGPVPTIGKRNMAFAGWTGVPLLRPLVAVSQPNVADPDGWKPATPAPESLAWVREEFRHKFPQETNCKNPEENRPHPWKYRDEDIHVLKAYAAKTGWSLIDVALEGYACDGPCNGTGFIGQWFAISPDGDVRFLGTDMWLVDAGDYNASGAAQVLFATDGYNRGGYRLFWQDFRERAEFVFSYH